MTATSTSANAATSATNSRRVRVPFFIERLPLDRTFGRPAAEPSVSHAGSSDAFWSFGGAKPLIFLVPCSLGLGVGDSVDDVVSTRLSQADRRNCRRRRDASVAVSQCLRVGI